MPPDRSNSPPCLQLPHILVGQLFLLISFPCFIVFFVQLFHTRRWYPACPDFLRSLVLNAFFVGIFCLAHSVIRRKSQLLMWRGGAVLLSVLFLLGTLMSVPHILLYRCHITFLSIQAVLQTTGSEARNFVEGCVDFIPVAVVLLTVCSYLALLGWFLKHSRKNLGKTLNGTKALAALYALLIVLVALPIAVLQNKGSSIRKNSLIRSHFVLRNVIEVGEALDNQNRQEGMRQLGALPVDFGDPLLSGTEQRRSYLLILGEGASRHHMSLYGYPRPTSPELDAMKKELLIYDNVISMYGSTAPSLSAAFLFPEIQKGQQGIASLLNLHREAGFKTYWLTNNLAEKKGEGASWFSVSADVHINANRATSFTQLSSYDEILLPELAKIFAEDAPNKFIVVHLAGMHPTYAFRYPAEEALFADGDREGLYNQDTLGPTMIKKINQYDNAMRYNNKIVAQMISLLADRGGNSYALYLSDHAQQLGEVAGSFLGHLPTGGTKFMYDIPFVVWLSPEYRQNNRTFVEALTQGVHRFWKMDDSLGHSVGELSRIQFGGFTPEQSIFSDKYLQPDTKIGGGEDYANLPGADLP